MSNLRRLKAAEIMNEHVVTGRPEESISNIAARMERRKIGSVVITKNRRVIGILTERDFARIARKGIIKGRDRAKHHMIKPVVTTKSDTSVADVLKLMRKKHIRHIPVLDKNRRLVGIISSRDLVNLAMDVIKTI
jgi:CBS domain-containing protein